MFNYKKKIRNLVKTYIIFLKFPFVVFKSAFRGEFHYVNFYIDRYIKKRLGFYKYRTSVIKHTVESVNNTAFKIIGAENNTYSGATAPEVASGFDICIKLITNEKKNLKYLEIGSAKGKSMALIGELTKNYYAKFNGISIDPYFNDSYVEGNDKPNGLLSSNKQSRKIPIDNSSREQALKLWSAFNLNVEQLRLTSNEGLAKLSERKEKYDLVYIDGFHDGLTPISDFLGILDLIQDGSIIMIDDWHWANIHNLKKICDNLPGLLIIDLNWKVAAYRVINYESLTG